MVRVLSAAVLVALLIVTVWWLPPWATVSLAILAAAMAGAEFAGLARAAGAYVPAEGPAVAAGIACAALAYADTNTVESGALLIAIVLVAASIGGALMTLASSGPGATAFAQPAATVMAAAYVGLPLGAAAWIRETHGPAVLTWLIAVIALSDSAQYYTGRAFGRRKLAPVVSPGKTVEGALGGMAAAAAAGAGLATLWMPGTPILQAALVALGLALFGMAGDLFESLLKRSAGVKDSGTLIPGHGGVLDRVDAILFAAPMFYVYLRAVAP
jgi:phosphatidate cytidylyltransferase